MRDRAESPVAPTDVLYVDSDADFAQLVERSLTRLDPTVSVQHVESASAAFDVVEPDDPTAGSTGETDAPVEAASGTVETNPERDVTAGSGDGPEEAATVDCVVSAYALRDTDAVSFLEQFRKRYHDLPFVLFTGAGSETVAADAIAAGVSAYVPVRAGENNFELLAQRIWTVTQGYRAKRRAEATAAELRRAYQRTKEAVAALDHSGQIIFVNDTFADRYDLDRTAIAGESLWRVVPAFASTEIEAACRSVTADRDPRTVETDVGDSRVRARVYPDEDGGVIVYADDVTEYRRAVARHDSLAAVADGVGTPALVVDADAQVVFANDPATRRLGVEALPDGPVGPNIASVVAEPDADRVTSTIQTVIGRARQDGGFRAVSARPSDTSPEEMLTEHTQPASQSVTDEANGPARVVEAVGVPGTETTADLRLGPVTVDDEAHALVVVVETDDA
jgi:PAS domain-containing protein